MLSMPVRTLSMKGLRAGLQAIITEKAAWAWIRMK
jgi:hypothetical protein